MTAASIIAGSLVDVRNVGTHKSVKLTIHVPEEHARRVIDAFGWPTGVNPITVAVARIDPKAVQRPETLNAAVDRPRPVSPVALAGATKERNRIAQRAGILCNERAFRVFLADKFEIPIPDPEGAKLVIYEHCDVKSRRDITPENVGWSDLMLAYQLWLNAPAVVPA